VGKQVYGSKCAGCHAEGGEGKEKWRAEGDFPDMTTADFKAKWTAAKIAKVVREGVPGTKMRAFASKLSDAEIEAVAAYVRTL